MFVFHFFKLSFYLRYWSSWFTQILQRKYFNKILGECILTSEGEASFNIKIIGYWIFIILPIFLVFDQKDYSTNPFLIKTKSQEDIKWFYNWIFLYQQNHIFI